MAASKDTNVDKIVPEIEVKGLSYAFPDGSSGLRDVELNLPPGSRTLLIGGTYSCKTIQHLKIFSSNCLLGDL
jgi:CCR4-NOT complex subunit CAF16